MSKYITGNIYAGMEVIGQGAAVSPKGKFPDWIVWKSENAEGGCCEAEFDHLVQSAPDKPKEEPPVQEQPPPPAPPPVQEEPVIEATAQQETEPEDQEEEEMDQGERDKRFAKTLIEFSLSKLEQFVEEGGVDHLIDVLIECENERDGGARKGGLKLLKARKKGIAEEK